MPPSAKILRNFATRQRAACMYLLGTIALFSTTGGPAKADAADEIRALREQTIDLFNAKKFGDAETLASKGLALCTGLDALKGQCLGLFNELLGDVAVAQTQYSKALEYYQQALGFREQQLAGDDRAIALIQVKIGRTQAALHHDAEAETALKGAVGIFEKRTPPEREFGVALFELTRIYIAADRPEAVDTARRAVDVYTAVQGPNGPTIPIVKRYLGAALLTSADRQIKETKLGGAERSLREGIALFDPPLNGWETLYAKSLVELGTIYDLSGRYGEAEPYELRALEYRAKSAGPADPLLLQILAALAGHYDLIQKPSNSTNYANRIISALDQSKLESPTLVSALLWLGRAQIRQNHYPEADITYARALDVVDRLTKEDDPLRASVLIDVASLRIDEERYDEAETQYQAALALAKKYSYRDTSIHSSALAGLATFYRETGRYHETEQLFSEAVQIDEAAGTVNLRNLANGLRGLASVLRREARYSDAEATLLRSLTMPIPEGDRAELLNALGLIYSTMGQYAKAATLLTEALGIEQKTLPNDATLTLDTETNLAQLDIFNARYIEAETERRGILSLVELRGLPRSTEVALHSVLLADALIPNGKLDDAEQLSKRALDIYEERLGSNNPRAGTALRTLASIEVLRGKDEDAEAHYRRALAIDERVLGADNPVVGGDLVVLAPVLQRLGKRQEAKADADRALTIVTAQFGNDSLMATGAMLGSANLAYEEARYSKARELVDHIRQVQEHTLGPDHSSLVGSWLFTARLDIAQGQLDAAGAAVERAAQIAGKALPAGHPFYIDLLQGNADLAAARGDLAGAEQDDRQAVALADKLFAPDHPIHIQAVDRLVVVLWADGKRAEAEKIRRSELAKIEEKPGTAGLAKSRAMRNLAAILVNSARIDDAISVYRQAIEIDERVAGSSSREVAWDELGLELAFVAIGQFDEAEMALARVALLVRLRATPNSRLRSWIGFHVWLHFGEILPKG